MTMTNKIIFSGIQPTGQLTLGNYLGALKNWNKIQDDGKCIYSIADQHAITVFQDPKSLKNATLELSAGIIASGIDYSINPVIQIIVNLVGILTVLPVWVG